MQLNVRDILPSPESLRIKIVEESGARRNENRGADQNALLSKKSSNWNKNRQQKPKVKGKEEFKFRYHRCKMKGHKAIECRNKVSEESNSPRNNELLLLATVEKSFEEQGAFHARIDSNNNGWCLESGATSHLCIWHKFSNINDLRGEKLKLANNSSTDITGSGTVSFATVNVNGKKGKVNFTKLLHVPDLRENLISISKITDKNLKVTFRRDYSIIADRSGNTVLRARGVGNLHYLNNTGNVDCQAVSRSSLIVTDSLETWHHRLGHLNASDIIITERSGAIRELKLAKGASKLECKVCLRSKMTFLPDRNVKR